MLLWRARTIFLLVLVFSVQGCGGQPELPDLDARTDPWLEKLSIPDDLSVAERKHLFFSTLAPVVSAENQRVLRLRQTVEMLRERAQKHELTESELVWLKQLADIYRVKTDGLDHAFWVAMLERVDVVPASLVLAQAALESAWGRSRFAREGNNLFGQWCFRPGCGLAPAQRDAGKKHEVAVFKSVNLAVRAYLNNLNRLPAYAELRAARAAMRRGEQPASHPGMLLARGLSRYSELGEKYAGHVRNIIRQNNLTAYNQVWLAMSSAGDNHDG